MANYTDLTIILVQGRIEYGCGGGVQYAWVDIDPPEHNSHLHCHLKKFSCPNLYRALHFGEDGLTFSYYVVKVESKHIVTEISSPLEFTNG